MRIVERLADQKSGEQVAIEHAARLNAALEHVG
jgi:hypothetical protein